MKPKDNFEALKNLADAEGYDTTIQMLEDLMNDRTILHNAICMNCGVRDRMEPDQDKGYCSECGKNDVKHAFILAGIF